ncbi:unnamed protein product [Soboliphyme baturini]|uniref:LIM zinc-binding domain-containing protein n=1 Tax=Soboliphyme baturini TaxID=241478 RepID=A0A183J9B4_9BILA|nr:unnamed protein product [Soboliphyme baturini]
MYGIACKQRLQEQGFFVQNGDYYCPSDYRAKFGIRCAECSQYVEGDVVHFLGASYHPECFRCTYCKKEIPSGNINYNGRDRACQQCTNKMAAELKISSSVPGESQTDLVDGRASPVGKP